MPSLPPLRTHICGHVYHLESFHVYGAPVIYINIYIFFSGNGTVGTTLGKILGILYHSALNHFIWVLCCPVSFLLFAPGFYFSVIINYNSYCFFSLVSLT